MAPSVHELANKATEVGYGTITVRNASSAFPLYMTCLLRDYKICNEAVGLLNESYRVICPSLVQLRVSGKTIVQSNSGSYPGQYNITNASGIYNSPDIRPDQPYQALNMVLHPGADIVIEYVDSEENEPV